MELTAELMTQMGYALGVGVLIGLERSMGSPVRSKVAPLSTSDGERQAESSPPRSGDPPVEFLGVRTFAVLSLVGFAAALAARELPLVAPFTLAGISLLVISMYWRYTEAGVGITTEAAAIGSCALGMLCAYHHQAAGVLALLLTVLLASKGFAHQTVRKMKRVELTDTLKFLVVILIILPLLPREALDPYGVLKPYKVGLLVVLISGISFVGYFLTRILGAQKGLGLTGVLGASPPRPRSPPRCPRRPKKRPTYATSARFRPSRPTPPCSAASSSSSPFWTGRSSCSSSGRSGRWRSWPCWPRSCSG